VPKESIATPACSKFLEIKLASSSIKALIKSEKIPRVSTLIGNESSLTTGLMPVLTAASTNENRIGPAHEPPTIVRPGIKVQATNVATVVTSHVATNVILTSL
jgi:hypothetical protein